jgi:Domain of unknown function (DUF1906)
MRCCMRVFRRWATRQAPALVASLLAGGLLAAAGASPASAGTPAGLKQVLYQGYTFDVPAAWPVIDEALHPRTCVRFDQHAVYLGGPGPDQACPSWLFGTTEAVVIQTGPGSVRRTATENPVSREITATAPRVRITATFDRDPNIIYTMLARADLPAPQIVLPNPALLDAAEGKPAAAQPAVGQPGQPGHGKAAVLAATTASQLTRQASAAPIKAIPVRSPTLPAAVANFRGLGFDSCAAPSGSAMRAWRRHSPYRAVGIYIGGSDRACDQSNLTAGWVRRQASAGWKFFPMYAGPQAAFGELSNPAAQGTRAAADAVAQAQRLGFGPRTPIYYDMEAYPARDTGKALRFLSAWTVALHRLNYLSGVYSSSRSGIIDLARQYGRGSYVMPDAIYDALWNGSRNVSDSAYGSKAWPRDHRLHQFSGNDTQTYGGATIDVDEDYLDIGLAVPGGTMEGSQAAESSAVFYEGADHHLWRQQRGAHSRWQPAVDMGGHLTGQPTVVAVGGSVLDVFYRGGSGSLWLVRRLDGRWQPARQIALMGDLGSVPRAVAQPNGVIDVFWKGSADDHLWHGQYTPGRGWSGPQRLGGQLSGPPSPVENRYGVVQVFWEGPGPGRTLWRVTRRLGQGWSRPASLGMGPMGGAPHATALPSGAIDVVWRGSTSPHHVWSAFLTPGQRSRVPKNLGGVISGAPWPAAASGTARVFFRGRRGGLWELAYRSEGRWRAPARVPTHRLGSVPFAAAGMGAGPFEVFWKGVHGGLWAASSSGAGWQVPQSLGGHLG